MYIWKIKVSDHDFINQVTSKDGKFLVYVSTISSEVLSIFPRREQKVIIIIYLARSHGWFVWPIVFNVYFLDSGIDYLCPDINIYN